jgi:hypothetical protein
MSIIIYITILHYLLLNVKSKHFDLVSLVLNVTMSLKMEGVCNIETFTSTYNTTRRYYPQYKHQHFRPYNLKSQI